jgi:predicted AAA+ superfamily ATPase
MQKSYPRILSKSVDIALSDTPVVVINGPRQSGKTTLVKQYTPNLPYFTLDDDNILNAVKQDPVGFIERTDKVIIDEIQRAPELLRAIKLSVDQNRQAGRFLLTGSTNILAMPNIGDSLAGRMEILNLLPLSLAEIQKRNKHFFKYAMKQNWPLLSEYPQFDSISHALVGGYPEMLSRNENSRRFAWAKSYLKAIIEKDVKDISAVDKPTEMPLLLEILAQQSGQLTNFTQIGTQIQLSNKTTQKYIHVFENLFLIKSIRPWHKNTLNRLIKTPKIYFLDSGLLAAVNKITLEKVQNNPMLSGALLETWVYGELLKMIDQDEDLWNIFFYRDKDQVEVDFVLENSANQVIGIEVKASSTIFNHDFRGLRKLATVAGDNWQTGIILYKGHQCLSFGDKLWAIPFSFLD